MTRTSVACLCSCGKLTRTIMSDSTHLRSHTNQPSTALWRDWVSTFSHFLATYTLSLRRWSSFIFIGGWVNRFGRDLPKKTFFWTPSLNAKVTHWLTEKTLAPTLPMWPWSLKIPDEDYWCDWQMVISYAYGDDGHGGWPGLSLRWLTCRLKRWLTWWWRYLMNGDTFGGDVRCGGHGCWEGGQNGEVSDGSWRVACGGVLNPIANCFVNPVNIWSIGHFSH